MNDEEKCSGILLTFDFTFSNTVSNECRYIGFYFEMFPLRKCLIDVSIAIVNAWRRGKKKNIYSAIHMICIHIDTEQCFTLSEGFYCEFWCGEREGDREREKRNRNGSEIKSILIKNCLVGCGVGRVRCAFENIWFCTCFSLVLVKCEGWRENTAILFPFIWYKIYIHIRQSAMEWKFFVPRKWKKIRWELEREKKPRNNQNNIYLTAT